MAVQLRFSKYDGGHYPVFSVQRFGEFRCASGSVWARWWNNRLKLNTGRGRPWEGMRPI